MSENNNGIRNSSSFRPGGGGGEEINNSGGSYALSGKIMLSAIVASFFVVVLIFLLHIYARWYLFRARRRHSPNRRSRRRRSQLIFYVDQDATPAAAVSRGIDARVLKLLPVFTFSSKTHPDSVLECAVCLSEFEENESGRVLPKCNHSFHSECIDMWFHSHSTCPLCRTSVEDSVPVSDNPGDLVITINEPSDGESRSNLGSDFCTTCHHEGGPAGSSAVRLGRKLSIDVPKRNIEGFRGEWSGCDSGTSQSYKSPMSRMLSFKRILSRERSGNGTSPSPSASPINATVSESVMERGVDETPQTQS